MTDSEMPEKPEQDATRVPSSAEIEDGMRTLAREIEATRTPIAAAPLAPAQKLDPVLGFERVIRNRRELVTPAQASGELPPELGITAHRERRTRRLPVREEQPEQQPPTATLRRSRLEF